MQIAQLLPKRTVDQLGFCSTESRDGAPRAPKVPPPPFAPETTFDEQRMTLLVEAPGARVHLAALRARAQKHRFTAKTEWWLTVIGYPTGRLIAKAIEDLDDARWEALVEAIETLVDETSWNWHPLRDEKQRVQYWCLRRDYPDKLKNGRTRRNRRWAVTMLVEVPSLEDFYDQLENLLGSALDDPLPRPVAHITLFVKGASLDGIGLASPAEFETAKVKRWHTQMKTRGA